MAFLSSYLSRERVKRISPYVQGDVLDIGCQRGQLRQKLGDQIIVYTGIDLSLPAIIKAKENHPDCDFKQVNLDDDSIGYENRFDTIVMLAVIEHLFNLKHIGLELAGALRPDGRLIITSPTNFGNDIIHRIGCRLGLFSKTAEDDHICIFNQKRFEIFAIEVGLVTLPPHWKQDNLEFPISYIGSFASCHFLINPFIS